MKTLILLLALLFAFAGYTRAQWVPASNGMGTRQVNSFIANGDTLYAGTLQHGIYKTINEGANWSQTPLNNSSIYSFAVNWNFTYAGSDTGAYASYNNGLWYQTVYGTKVLSLTVSGTNLLAGFSQSGVLRSGDYGLNWVTTSLDNHSVYSLTSNAVSVFAGTDSNGIYKSTNNGVNWSQTSLNNQFIRALASNGNTVFAGSPNGVYISVNNGVNWSQTSLNNQDIRSLAVNGSSVFAGTYSGGVYVSGDNGTSWIQKNEGLTNNSILSLYILDNEVYLGTQIGVFRRPFSELIGIQQISVEVPAEFSLSQNYPNPFNPVTNVQFTVPKQTLVKLVVYDMLGREVETLVNKTLAAGTYKSDWNASKYTSGVYFYKLESESFTETKKMILIK